MDDVNDGARRTTSNLPPWYGVPSGPGKEPMRWKGLSSTSSILIAESLSFLQSTVINKWYSVGTKWTTAEPGGTRPTCDFLVHATKTSVHGEYRARRSEYKRRVWVRVELKGDKKRSPHLPTLR